LRRHKISIVDITQRILMRSESIIASRSVYASDALHAATFEAVSKRRPLDDMLSNDKHFERPKGIVTVMNLNEISLDSDVS